MHGALTGASVSASFIRIEGVGHGFEGADLERANSASAVVRATSWERGEVEPGIVAERLRQGQAVLIALPARPFAAHFARQPRR